MPDAAEQFKVSKMQNLIITTPEQLREIISDEVARAIKCATPPTPEHTESDLMNVHQTIAFLASYGFKLTPQALYNRVYKDSIPYRKFGGRKLLFLRSELLDWIAQGTANPAANRQAAALRIAENAGRKEVRYE